MNNQHQSKTSTYVRVSQLWAGDGFGAQFTPRVGDEVLVLFLGDSPNYPFIGGSLYNPKRLYPNKANQYLSGFVSQTPNRQGSNSILFNDTNGKEQIEISTTGNKIETIEKDHTVNIDGSQKVTIGQNQETTINESQHTHIKQNQETKVEGSQITKVTGDVKITSTEGSIELYSKKTSIIESDDSIYLNAKKKIVLRAGTGITLKVGGNHITLDPASLTTFPMMGLSGEVPPFASVSATKAITEDPIKAENTETPALKINPDDMYWPPYNFLAKEGEQEIKVDYQWDTSEQENISIAICTVEEANEYLDLLMKDTHGQLSTGKDYTGLASGMKSAYNVAKELGGLGATAKAVNINGVMNVVIENYNPRYLDLGTRWQQATQQMLKIGYALNTVQGNLSFLRGNIFVEIVFSGAVNSVDYMLHDEKTLGEVVGQFSADVTKGITVAAIAQGVTLILRAGLISFVGVTLPVSATIGIFALACFKIGDIISTLDEQYQYTKPMKDSIEAYIEKK